MPLELTKGLESAKQIEFTGRVLKAFGRELPATCIVRNEVNGWREPWQVVYTGGSTTPHGLAYQPRLFPPGVWEVTDVVDMPLQSVYWPTWIGTDATQELVEWQLDDEDMYRKPTRRTITGRGYGIHHARVNREGRLLASNTTLGCINVRSPDDAQWLGERIREAFTYKFHVMLYVLPWDEWQEA